MRDIYYYGTRRITNTIKIVFFMKLSKSSDKLNPREKVSLLEKQRAATVFITRLEQPASVPEVRETDLLSMEILCRTRRNQMRIW